MKVIFFGLGSIGRKHAKILRDNFDFELFAFRTFKGEGKNNLGIKEITTWREVRNIKPDVAFITNPTYLHVPFAIKCARLGVDLFIEKPISHNLNGINKLKTLCKKNKLTCYIAYSLRFNPVIKNIKELIKGKEIYHARAECSSFLPHWRKGRNYLKTYSASKREGGGVLLDLSHEFDYLQYLFGSIKTIKGVCGRMSNVTVDAEDYADTTMILGRGISVNLHLDFLSLLEERSIAIDFKDGFIYGDLLRKSILYCYKGKKRIIKFKQKKNEHFIEQIRFFFSRLNRKPEINNLKESIALLKKILPLRDKGIL